MKKYIDQVRIVHPLIHCITNYVTVNDCANILLACGASPIMADDPDEVEEITGICMGTVLNIGTLNSRTIEAMLRAGKQAKRLKHPVILDPVGAGASRLRTDTAMKILHEVHPDVVRCNMSELKMLMNAGSASRGVDVSELDRITESNVSESISFLKIFSEEHHCVTAVSGAADLITDPYGRACVVHNGDPVMADMTGSGCMLSALTGAFTAGAPENIFESTCAAFCAMGIAGEIAKEQMTASEGNASCRNHLIDAVYRCDSSLWERRVRCEMF